MKISVLRDHLNWGASLASKIINSRSNLPILSNLMLKATEDNILQIESSNLELSVRLKIAVKVDEPGQITVPARKFADYLSVVKEDKLELLVDKNQLVVRGEQNQTSFVTMPSGDYPSLPTSDGGMNSIVVESDKFRNTIRKTVFATSSRNDQPVLTGVLFDFGENGRLISASSDSFRLSVTDQPIRNEIPRKIIIPASALTEVERLLGDDYLKTVSGEDTDGQLHISFSKDDNQIFFQVGSVEVISRLLEADFPSYERIIPESFSGKAIFDRLELMDSIKTTSIFSSKEGQLIRMSLDKDGGRVSLKAQNSDVGSHEGSIDCQIESENNVEIGFNSRFLLEGLGSFSEPKVRFNYNDGKAAVLIEPEESADPAFTYRHIVMPMDLEGI